MATESPLWSCLGKTILVPVSAAATVSIGARIKDLLGERSAAWLAEKAGVERSTVTRIVRGERNPTPETLAALATVLGMSLEQLVVGTDAEARVKEAANLVSRAHYEEAVGQIVRFERQVNDLLGQLRAEKEARLIETRKRRKAEELADALRAKCEALKQEVRRREDDVRTYEDALRRAVADVAKLQTQVEELGKAVDRSRMTGRITAILAGTAAVVTMASYLRDRGAGSSGSPETTSESEARKERS